MAVQKSSYAEDIYHQLRDDILSGQIRPGDRLAETEVAQRMGTSQGPVREAFTRLREQGLLISFPHRGSYVSEISEEEARHAYAVRGAIEPLAMQHALPLMGDAEFEQLETQIRAMEAAAHEDEPPDEFLYDPRDPVPTVGGQTLIPGGGFFAGPRDRRAVEWRPDVLCYSSGILQEALEITGPVTATLHVASSAPDTDFTAALIDVYPDGRAVGLTDGILRLRYRDGFDRAQLLEPGRPYEIEIDLVATSNLFRAGHRLRIEISSSNFPRFDRNPNNGGVVALATESDMQVAQQRVFHDAARPSFVTLPVIPPTRVVLSAESPEEQTSS
jgi:DNA-binding transcriptional regulator YhcF (GntR family)